MISLKQINKRVASVLGTALILSGVALPAAFPVMASAAALNSRSIKMSSSAKGATGVSYELNIGNVSSGIPTSGGIVVQFCNDSPLVGLACTAPPGMSVTTASASSGTITNVDASTFKWVPGSAVSAGGTLDVTFSGITNPSSEGTFYARITTYTAAIDYTDADTPGTVVDKGGVALSIVKSISVTAYVQESLSFCVSHTAPGPNCGGTVDDPSLLLGQETSPGSGVFALDTTNPSTGDDYAQVNTNAAHGATVNLHSSATGCGGLIRLNDGTNCDITAQNNAASTVAGGDAKFGLELANPVLATGGTGVGTITPVANYQGQFFIDYVSGDASGVTSTYGSPLFSSSGPTNDYNVKMTLAASAAPATPAGIYSADLMLVATGTF